MQSMPCLGATQRWTRPQSTRAVNRRGELFSTRLTCRCHEERTTSPEQIPSRAPIFAAIVAAVQLSTSALQCTAPLPAEAILRSPNALISRSVDTALRRAIPAYNQDVHTIQDKLEDIQYLLRIPQRKPWGSMANNVRATQGLAMSKTKMMEAVPVGSQDEVTALLAELTTRLEKLQFAIDRQDADKVNQAVTRALATVADIELLQAPALSFVIPKEYQDAPLLTGRAMVEMEVEKADGSSVFIDSENGGVMTRGTLQIAVDGYSAPVTAGNFVSLVLKGKYNGSTWGSGYASVVAGKGAQPDSAVPLEILALGDFSPVYRLPLDVAGGELPVLPLSIRGAVAMTRLPDSDQYLSGEEFFIYKFSPEQGGLSGLAFDEGTFGVFGYVTQGMEDTVSKLETGDRIVSAKLISGQDRLINVG